MFRQLIIQHVTYRNDLYFNFIFFLSFSLFLSSLGLLSLFNGFQFELHLIFYCCLVSLNKYHQQNVCIDIFIKISKAIDIMLVLFIFAFTQTHTNTRLRFYCKIATTKTIAAPTTTTHSHHNVELINYPICMF